MVMHLASIAIRLVKSKRNYFSFRIALNALNAKVPRDWRALLVMAVGFSSVKNVMGVDTTLLVPNVGVPVKLSVVTVMGKVRLKARRFRFPLNMI